MTEPAIESFRKVLEFEQWWDTHSRIGYCYLFEDGYAAAESVFQEMIISGDAETRAWGREQLAYVPIYQGKLDAALSLLDDAMAADRMELLQGERQPKYPLRALINLEKGRFDLAREDLTKAIELTKGRVGRPAGGEPGLAEGICSLHALEVCVLAEAGDVAAAMEIAEQIPGYAREQFEWPWKRPETAYHWALGVIELAKDNPDSAIVYLEEAVAYASPFAAKVRFYLAQAYQEAGRLTEAIEEYQRLVTKISFDTAYYALWVAKAHSLLARTYEEAGQLAEARQSYEKFLDLWKDADAELTEVDDARRRLVVLQGS
jgi:tetratricopeptide (TPR) repeat protein